MTYQEAHDLWNSIFRKTACALDADARGRAELDRDALALSSHCDGRLPLCTLARSLGIAEPRAIVLAARLAELGWITRRADAPSDPSLPVHPGGAASTGRGGLAAPSTACAAAPSRGG